MITNTIDFVETHIVHNTHLKLGRFHNQLTLEIRNVKIDPNSYNEMDEINQATIAIADQLLYFTSQIDDLLNDEIPFVMVETTCSSGFKDYITIYENPFEDQKDTYLLTIRYINNDNNRNNTEVFQLTKYQLQMFHKFCLDTLTNKE